MYIYRALINTLRAHMIHINLNTIYTRRAQSYQNNLHKVYGNMHARTLTHTHTHNDCSRNWVLISVGVEILWEEEGFQFGFKRWRGWVMSKVLWEWIPNVGPKARESTKAMTCIFIAGFSACGCRKKSVAYKMECRHVAVQKGKQDQNHLQLWNTYKRLHS